MIQHILTGCPVEVVDVTLPNGEKGKSLQIHQLDHSGNILESFGYPMEMDLAKSLGHKLLGLPGELIITGEMPDAPPNGKQGRG